MKGIKIDGPFKLQDGKLVRDEKAEEARLPVSARIARRSSKRVRVARRRLSGNRESRST